MPLCGSSYCGCALVSVAATSGTINGDLPTIDVAGSGTPGSPWNLTLNDEWADEVANAINGMVAGVHTGTTDGSGDITITFGITFASPPVVVAMMRKASETAAHVCHANGAATTTTQSLRVINDGTPETSTSVTIHWIAIGVPA